MGNEASDWKSSKNRARTHPNTPKPATSMVPLQDLSGSLIPEIGPKCCSGFVLHHGLVFKSSDVEC